MGYGLGSFRGRIWIPARVLLEGRAQVFVTTWALLIPNRLFQKILTPGKINATVVCSMSMQVLLDTWMGKKAEKLGLEYLSYRQMAQMIHVSPTTLMNFNNGKSDIRISTLEKICRFLECTPGQILKLE